MNGIIFKDIKPKNILIGKLNGKLVMKMLACGTAKYF
jgi:serine/threonine protein kinase